MKNAQKIFRTVAIIEAFTWAGLLISMYFKYLAEHKTPVGVQIFGSLHGAAFIAYCGVTLYCSRQFTWKHSHTLLGLASAIPPFFTVLFDMWAEKRGLFAAKLRKTTA